MEAVPRISWGGSPSRPLSVHSLPLPGCEQQTWPLRTPHFWWAFLSANLPAGVVPRLSSLLRAGDGPTILRGTVNSLLVNGFPETGVLSFWRGASLHPNTSKSRQYPLIKNTLFLTMVRALLACSNHPLAKVKTIPAGRENGFKFSVFYIYYFLYNGIILKRNLFCGSLSQT